MTRRKIQCRITSEHLLLWAVDPKPMAQDEAVHVRKPRVLVHRKPKTGPSRMCTARASSDCIMSRGCAAQIPPGELKRTERAGVKGPGDQCPGRDRREERYLTWRSVDSGDISHLLPIQQGSCFWKVPLPSKVAFCFGKGPPADIPFLSSREAEHQ